MSFYTVFEGKKPGVYDSCMPCSKMVSGCGATKYDVFSHYDDVVSAWEIFCKATGRSRVDFQEGLLQPEGGESTAKGNDVNCSMVTKTHNTHKFTSGCSSVSKGSLDDQNIDLEQIQKISKRHWIIQHNMQQELEYICNTLKFNAPVYSKDEVSVRKGIPYVRYKVSIDNTSEDVEPIVCCGRFGVHSGEAKEDAAVVAMRRLVNMTGHKIRDFNYYNVKILEQKIQLLAAEKITMTNINRNLKEQIDILTAVDK